MVTVLFSKIGLWPAAGLKILYVALGLKSLPTTVVEDGLIENSDIGLCELVFCKQYSPNSRYFHGLVSHPGMPELHHFLFL